jgi:hypothetical protein
VAENASYAASNHRVDMPRVTVDDDRVVHKRLGASRRGVKCRGRGPLTVVVDDGGFGKASRAMDWCAHGGGRQGRGR